MSEMEDSVHRLDTDMRAKTASLKLAHTRLENRTSRPGVDLCRDEVLNQLYLIIALGQKLDKIRFW